MVLVPLILIGIASIRRPWRRATLLAVALVAFTRWPLGATGTLFEGRNFYGVLRLVQQGELHTLFHGTTLHGAQSTDPRAACEPLTYYARTSPVGQLFDSFTHQHAKQRPALVGLGAAALTAYARPEQHWTFYEINPLIAEIAENPAYFSYLRQCVRSYTIQLGDARLNLQQQPDGAHDALIVDAFSSDAIPIHLLTREALRVYVRTLAPRGVIAFHITNRFLDLAPVVGALADDAKLVAFARLDARARFASYDNRAVPADWVVVARDPSDVGEVVFDPRWQRIHGSGAAVWRDAFSNLFAAIRLREFRF